MKLAVSPTNKTLQTLWMEAQHQTIQEVATQNGMTRQQLVALFQQSGLSEGGRGSQDPSKETIRRLCREFQEKWTPEQAVARWVGNRRINSLT